MSVAFYGDYDLTETVRIPINSFDSNDPSASVTITNLAAGDIKVYKDGTLRAPTGITISLNVDGATGNHFAILDLSDVDDDGAYANGSRYAVRMEGTTIDSGTVNAWIGSFSIGVTLRPTTAGRKLTVESDGDLAKVNLCEANSDMVGTDNAPTKTEMDTAHALLATVTALATAQTAIDAIPTTAMRGTEDANTVVPDAAGVAPTASEIVTAVAAMDIDGKALQAVLRYIAAVLVGKLRNAGTGTETVKGVDGSTDRVEFTVDEDGNRTAITYDP